MKHSSYSKARGGELSNNIIWQVKLAGCVHTFIPEELPFNRGYSVLGSSMDWQ